MPVNSQPPTTSEQFADWIKDNTSSSWPWPTFMPNFADLVIAPISGVIVVWWTRPSGWITNFTNWITGRAESFGLAAIAESFGLAAIVDLGQLEAAEQMVAWYEEYCEDTNVPPYANWVEEDN